MIFESVALSNCENFVFQYEGCRTNIPMNTKGIEFPSLNV